MAKTSGSIDARPSENNNKALHTIAVYTRNFSGALRVQGTMAATPGNTDWFDITMDGEAREQIAFQTLQVLPTSTFMVFTKQLDLVGKTIPEIPAY